MIFNKEVCSFCVSRIKEIETGSLYPVISKEEQEKICKFFSLIKHIADGGQIQFRGAS
jgi:hypothetical protein